MRVRDTRGRTLKIVIRTRDGYFNVVWTSEGDGVCGACALSVNSKKKQEKKKA
jgi:succinate dehydrogenase/fumarate reductase-like Fe-S protein